MRKIDAVCTRKHHVDCDDDDSERWADVGELAEILTLDHRKDGLHRQIGFPASGAVGWYDEAEFANTFSEKSPCSASLELNADGVIRDADTGEHYGSVPSSLRSLYGAAPKMLSILERLDRWKNSENGSGIERDKIYREIRAVLKSARA